MLQIWKLPYYLSQQDHIKDILYEETLYEANPINKVYNPECHIYSIIYTAIDIEDASMCKAISTCTSAIILSHLNIYNSWNC